MILKKSNDKPVLSLPSPLTIYRGMIVLVAVLCLIRTDFSYAEKDEFFDESGEADTRPDKNWYQIEVLLFEHLNQSDYLIEPAQTTLPDINRENRHVLVSDTPVTDNQFQQLKDETLVLNDHKKKLSRSKNFRPVLLMGWKQLLLEDTPPRPVTIDIESKDPDSGEPTSFQGTIAARKSRYLHIDVDLAKIKFVNNTELPVDSASNNPVLSVKSGSGAAEGSNPEPVDRFHYAPQNMAKTQEPDSTNMANMNEPGFDSPFTEPATEPAELARFAVNELKTTRRMRSNELHYIDYPVFGLLTIIRPTQMPEYAKK
ncbi:MAG: hypothetical protein CSB48_14140 [Proteobacteria bacterium]|nr:MAG: hypothetical protein CSB48_14140 [Pseudomonadota bacterium]